MQPLTEQNVSWWNLHYASDKILEGSSSLLANDLASLMHCSRMGEKSILKAKCFILKGGIVSLKQIANS